MFSHLFIVSDRNDKPNGSLKLYPILDTKRPKDAMRFGLSHYMQSGRNMKKERKTVGKFQLAFKVISF